MKFRSSLLPLAFAVLSGSAGVPLLSAQESVDVAWSHVCQAARGRQMRLTTNTGETVEGYCTSVNGHDISLRMQDHRTVKIAGSAMTRIVVSPQQHQLQALGRDMRKSLKTGLRVLLTPMAPAGIALIPGTLAWGAVAAPFCVAGDLFARKSTETEIRPH